ncbi:MAG: molybdenum cofactor biosynthesis protein MoaE [Candidatus Lokiarchaeota archaeon]|nr:molybdenum cofactor biosynthesis protein MoaE [Candidatus Lokiarchaeota archaeon]
MNNNNFTQVQSGIYEKDEISLSNIIFSLKNHPKIKDVGSILNFTGIVRNTSKDGKLIRNLEIDAYEELANNSINKICKEIKEIPGIIDIIIVHFKGIFDIKDDLVHVVVASSHREEGFKALRHAVERYKKEIAVWKKEAFLDGSSEWVH